jgi:hypothetical protein
VRGATSSPSPASPVLRYRSSRVRFTAGVGAAQQLIPPGRLLPQLSHSRARIRPIGKSNKRHRPVKQKVFS